MQLVWFFLLLFSTSLMWPMYTVRRFQLNANVFFKLGRYFGEKRYYYGFLLYMYKQDYWNRTGGFCVWKCYAASRNTSNGQGFVFFSHSIFNKSILNGIFLFNIFCCGMNHFARIFLCENKLYHCDTGELNYFSLNTGETNINAGFTDSPLTTSTSKN